MQYAILCYNDEAAVGAWTQAQDAEVMERLHAVQAPLAKAGRLGPVARLVPTTAAATLRKGQAEPIVLDGPFAETKEQLLGFYIVEADDLDGALAIARDLARANPDGGSYEIRPVRNYFPATAAFAP